MVRTQHIIHNRMIIKPDRTISRPSSVLCIQTFINHPDISGIFQNQESVYPHSIIHVPVPITFPYTCILQPDPYPVLKQDQILQCWCHQSKKDRIRNINDHLYKVKFHIPDNCDQEDQNHSPLSRQYKNDSNDIWGIHNVKAAD